MLISTKFFLKRTDRLLMTGKKWQILNLDKAKMNNEDDNCDDN